MRLGYYLIGILVLVGVAFPFEAAAQRRDYFTDEEVELIRDAQEIDRRIEVLTHTIDRRLAVLKIDASGPKISGKDSDKWGPPPSGTRLELFSDIRSILQKAIDDIDNLAERPDLAVVPDKDDKKAKPVSVLLNKAVRNLGAAANRYEPSLKIAVDASTDEREKGLISASIDLCDEIIEALGKLPAEAPKRSNKDH